MSANPMHVCLMPVFVLQGAVNFALQSSEANV